MPYRRFERKRLLQPELLLSTTYEADGLVQVDKIRLLPCPPFPAKKRPESYATAEKKGKRKHVVVFMCAAEFPTVRYIEHYNKSCKVFFW